jgi:hypothetical protein
MNGFDGVMREGFDARFRAITEAGGVPRKRTRSVLHAIRRRRAVRARTATGVSVLAAGALAVGAINLLPAKGVAPMGFPTPPAGAPAWCDLNTYPAVNPEALGALPYDGRIYANFVNNVFVYVAPDGSSQVLQPDANGGVSVVAPDGRSTIYGPDEASGWSLMESDYSQGGAGSQDLGNSGDPGLAYEWTTTVPDTIPPSVDVAGLSGILSVSIGLLGTGFSPTVVPDGAIVETVFRWNDGHERAVKVLPGRGGARLADYSGLASVSVRVSNLAGGDTFEIASTYDATKTWAAACLAGAPVPASARPIVTTPPAPYLEGPESAVFRCLAPLPAEAEGALPATAALDSGVLATEENAIPPDFGPRGVLVTSSHEVSVLGTFFDPQSPGWEPAWSRTSKSSPMTGALTYHALAWVDADGVIVGREVKTADPDGVQGIDGDVESWGSIRDGRQTMTFTRGYVDTRGVPCDGVDPAAIDSASLVWLEGAGPDVDHMTWSWTRVWPASKN